MWNEKHLFLRLVENGGDLSGFVAASVLSVPLVHMPTTGYGRVFNGGKQGLIIQQVKIDWFIYQLKQYLQI